MLIAIRVCNRGPDDGAAHLLPTLWFRNTWSWGRRLRARLRALPHRRASVIAASHRSSATTAARATGRPSSLHRQRDNGTGLFGVRQRDAVRQGRVPRASCVDRATRPTGAAGAERATAHHHVVVPRGAARGELRLRLAPATATSGDPFGRLRRAHSRRARREADVFYAIAPPVGRRRRAAHLPPGVAGLLWSSSSTTTTSWLGGRPARQPPRPPPRARRNATGSTSERDVISMPDKWEYPWYAAWDLAFHCAPLSTSTWTSRRQQLDLMLPSGRCTRTDSCPPTRWNFGDVNPPVHAWAVWFSYTNDEAADAAPDRAWLERASRSCWSTSPGGSTARTRGRNAFEGGFLGLDNIGVFDRSARCRRAAPRAGRRHRVDGRSTAR